MGRPVAHEDREGTLRLIGEFVEANPGTGTLVVLACSVEVQPLRDILSTTDYADAIVLEDNTYPRHRAAVMRLWDYQGQARQGGPPNAKPGYR